VPAAICLLFVATNMLSSVHCHRSSLDLINLQQQNCHTAHVLLQAGNNAQNQSSQSLVVLAHQRTMEGLFFCQPVTAHRMDNKE
jgi:hypothetical protein